MRNVVSATQLARPPAVRKQSCGMRWNAVQFVKGDRFITVLGVRFRTCFVTITREEPNEVRAIYRFAYSRGPRCSWPAKVIGFVNCPPYTIIVLCRLAGDLERALRESREFLSNSPPNRYLRSHDNQAFTVSRRLPRVALGTGSFLVISSSARNMKLGFCRSSAAINGTTRSPIATIC